MMTTGNWRDSGRSARFGFVDAQAALPIFLFLVHIEWWTFWLALGITGIFTLLNRFGFTVVVFGRILRTFLVGPYKQARAWWSIF